MTGRLLAPRFVFVLDWQNEDYGRRHDIKRGRHAGRMSPLTRVV
jgi:hypothetical protein